MTATLTPAIPFSCINSDLDEPVLLECHQGTVCAYSRRSPDKTTPNEDAIAVVSLGDDHLVCIVADGLGGQPSGEQASALTIGLLIDRLSATRHAPGNIIQVILGSIEAANLELLDAAVGAATTLAIAEIHGSAVRSYHVGDSMIHRFQRDAHVHRHTVEHACARYPAGGN
jgi:serine/threonine protein phosphatase PrpC